MIFGVDATCWANGRGYGRFARELMRAMTRRAPGDRFVCFGDRRAFEAYPDPSPNVDLVEVAMRESPTVAAAADSGRTAGEGGVFTAQNVNGIASFLSGLMDTKTISASGCDAYSSPNLATKLDRVLRMSAGMLSRTKNSVQVFGDNAEAPVEHIHGTVKETNASK